MDGGSRLREKAQRLERKRAFELPLKELVEAGALCQANARAGVWAGLGETTQGTPRKKTRDGHLPRENLGPSAKENGP